MKIKKALAIIVCLVLSVACVLLFSRFWRARNESALMAEGRELIKKVEAYKAKNHKLPQYLSDIKPQIPDDYPLSYASRDGENYIIWFGTSLGESIAYHSDSKKWEDRDR